MRKPRSYTGEDVVEIHCHGGAFVVRQILAVVLVQGARLAEPGEFTRRAFLNGRMDLSQAEAVLDLIRARTDKSVDLAIGHFEGELSRWVGELRDELIDVLAQIEAAVDFPEEDIELLRGPDLIARIEAIRTKITTILATYDRGRLYREGARVCICGKPNVGKSSLLNALVGEQRAIVTAVPGTTRDVIEDAVNLDGLPVVLWDTAGLRETEDEVEKIGVGLTHQFIERADAIIAVLDGSTVLTEQDLVWLGALKDKKTLIVVNKNDLPQQLELESLRREMYQTEVVPVSARTGDGLDRLRILLRELLLGVSPESPIVLTNVRHRVALSRGDSGLALASSALRENQPAELVAVGLHDAVDGLQEIVGTVTGDDILEHIFSKFCIGK
jgi:tRNA modification GTPase